MSLPADWKLLLNRRRKARNCAAWRLNNPEGNRAAQQRYREKNAEKRKLALREWRRNNRDKVRAYRRKAAEKLSASTTQTSTNSSAS
jgi:hypothetical protein